MCMKKKKKIKIEVSIYTTKQIRHSDELHARFLSSNGREKIVEIVGPVFYSRDRLNTHSRNCLVRGLE